MKIPYLNPSLCKINSKGETILEIDQNICHENDIFTDTGIESYRTNINTWKKSTMNELPDPSFAIQSVSKIDVDRVIVKWNVTFVPDAVVTLASIGNSMPFWRVKFFNILDRYGIKSSFSWKSLFMFLQHLFFTGEMRLPHAVIEGTTELRFENIESPADDALELSKSSDKEIENLSEERKKVLPKLWKLVSHTETLNLVRLMKSNQLKNRKLATDLLEFLDTRRPPSYGLNQWNDAIIEKIPFQYVPGMRQFDIDGLEAEEQEQLLKTSSTILGYITGSILFLGLGFATVVMDKVFLHQDEKEGMSRTFQNRVHQYSDEYEEIYYE
jgi:hypothetical protein